MVNDETRTISSFSQYIKEGVFRVPLLMGKFTARRAGDCIALVWPKSERTALAAAHGVNRRIFPLHVVWTLAALMSAAGGAYLDHTQASGTSSITLYLTALFLGAHGRSRPVALSWIVTCLLLAASGSGTYDFVNLVWLAPSKQMVWAAMICVSVAWLYQCWVMHDLRRRLNAGVSERQELADALPHVIWGTSAEGRCEFLNDRYTETFGISRSTAITEQTWVNPIHPADFDKMQDAWRSAIDNGISFYSAHARMRMNDGSYRWMESIGRSVSSAKTGETLKWFGSLVDVQNQVEEREAIARLQLDLQSVSDDWECRAGAADEKLRAIFETREIGWIEYDVKSLGRLSEALRLQGIADVHDHLEKHPADTEELSHGVRLLDASQHTLSLLGFENFTNMALERTRGRHLAIDVEIAILTALVKGATTSCGIAKLSDAEGMIRVFPFTVWIFEDGVAKAAFLDTSTADACAQAAGLARRELARVNRVAAASALSASLIHQISQPITAISLDVATAARLIASGDRSSVAASKVMDRLRWNTKRLSDIGTSTRDTLRNGPQTRQQVNIVELSRRSYQLLLDPLDAEQKRFTIVADDDLPVVMADPIALQQVMFALLQNALDARSMAGEPQDISVTISSAPQSTEVNVVVADRGSGIDNEHIAFVYDPFFSTKADRLGFGLTICQSVIEGFGGTLTLTNRPGGGASAQFSIPVR